MCENSPAPAPPPAPAGAVPALVLAGGRTSAEFAAEAGVPQAPGARALAPIHGVAMVRYVLRALRGARAVDRVILVAPPGFPDQPEADCRIEADGDLPGNIERGLAACGGAEYALLATADIPFITPEEVDDHVARCVRLEADCCYAAVPRSACEARFPGMKRTYLHTPAGSLTGGNVVFQRIAAFPQEADLLRAAYLHRKNPLFLARLIGWRNVTRFLARRLTLEEIGAAASRATGVRCRLVVTPHAALGTDVDRPEDLRLARRILPPG